MKNIIVVLFIFFQTSVSAQTYFFNKLFKPDTLSLGAVVTHTLDNAYIVAGPYISTNLEEGFYIRKTDLYGETKWFKAFETGNHSIFSIGGGILTKANNNTYILVGSRTYEDDELNQDVVMINFTENGEHLWTKIITEPNGVEYPYHISPTQDGGYILCGIQRSFTSNNHFYILKTDALGNKIWDKVLHEDKKGVAFSVCEENDGYVISGYMKNIDTQADIYIVKIDKNGQTIIWENAYGTPYNDTAGLLASDGNNNFFLVAAITDNNILKPYISKIDALGNTLWSKTFSNEVVGPQESPILITADGGFLTMYAYKNEINYYDVSIWRFTAQGDTLWTRKIPDTRPDENWYLKDIALASDSGYILSGFNYSTQSSWVVKTDSLGHTCSTMGCDSLAFATSVEELVFENSSFKISPNPAQHNLQFSWKENSLSTNKSYEIHIFDAFGKLVKKKKTNDFQTKLNVSYLENGIYFCQLFEENELLDTQKLMVLR